MAGLTLGFKIAMVGNQADEELSENEPLGLAQCVPATAAG